MIYDGSDFSFIQRYANTTYRKVDTINRWVDADINYSYRGLDLFGGSANLTVGMRNAFDRQPQKLVFSVVWSVNCRTHLPESFTLGCRTTSNLG